MKKSEKIRWKSKIQQIYVRIPELSRREYGMGEKNEKEICVLCKCMTNVNKTQHIFTRKYYIEGAGQLCEKCYRNLY